MPLGRQCQNHQISTAAAAAAAQVMVWKGIISNADRILTGYRTGMGRKVPTQELQGSEAEEDPVSLLFAGRLLQQ